VRYLPEWFPGAGFQSLARKSRVLAAQLRDEPFELVQKSMVGFIFKLNTYSPSYFTQADGTANPCITTELLNACEMKEVGLTPDDKNNVKEVVMAFFAGELFFFSLSLPFFSLPFSFQAVQTHPQPHSRPSSSQ
jgi:hypothetical protein